MKIGLTEIIFIVDRSGSMESIRKDMIGGFNSFLKEQRKVPTECKVSFYQFDAQHPVVETVYEQLLLESVPNLSKETFVPRGGTPLYDAVARVLKQVEQRFGKTESTERPEKILVVCITDGEENSSVEWSAQQVKQMIEHKQEKEGWGFVYLGANQDAWAVGGNLGFDKGSTLGYVASAKGTNQMWQSLSTQTVKYRSTAGTKAKVEFDDEDRRRQKTEGYKT